MSQTPDRAACVLTWLDCILDTVMGTLNRIDLHAAEKIFHAGYHTRKANEFEGISMIEFRKRYADRDLQTLKLSPVTNIFDHFGQLNRELVAQITQGPEYQKIEYTVNLYPYRLDDATIDALQVMIWNRLGKVADVHMVYLLPRDVTPAYVKGRFDAVYFYNVWDWINLHNDAFGVAFNSRLPEVIAYAPRMYFSKAPTAEEEQQLNADGDIFTELEKGVSPIIGVNLLDPIIFSTPVPPYYYHPDQSMNT